MLVQQRVSMCVHTVLAKLVWSHPPHFSQCWFQLAVFVCSFVVVSHRLFRLCVVIVATSRAASNVSDWPIVQVRSLGAVIAHAWVHPALLELRSTAFDCVDGRQRGFASYEERVAYGERQVNLDCAK